MQSTNGPAEIPVSSPGTSPTPLPFHVYARLLLCVFAAGAAVMIYQFIAVRILARYFGAAMDVWASEIAVCMAGLSLGYYLGGRLGDRLRALWPMGMALIAAAVAALVMEPIAVWCGERLLQVETAIQWHPLLAATAASFVPFLALGTVLPQAVRMAAYDPNRVGAAAGRIAALSTVGSIVGVLAIGHYLLERWPVLHVLYGLSALLIALGLALTVDAVARTQARTVAALIAGALAAMPAYAQTVQFRQYTAHQHVLVVDRGDTRALLFDNDVQSTMSLRDPYAGGLEYTDYFHVPMILKPTTTRVCFIGLGGGTGPKAFLRDYPHVTVDVVEIDRVVEQVARHFFHVPRHARLNVAIQDGRAFLNRSNRAYGAIIMDAYAGGPNGAYLPAHLATQEFFQIVHRRLAPGGSFVFNAIGIHGGMNHNVVEMILATLRSVFPMVYAYQASSSLNTVFVAVKVPGATHDEDGQALFDPWPHGPFLEHPAQPETLAAMARSAIEQNFLRVNVLPRRLHQVSRAQFAEPRAPILTDNHSPVDLSRRR